MAFSPDSSTPDETSTSRFCDHRHVVMAPFAGGTANKWNIESPLIDFIPGLSSCHIADFPRKLIESYNASDEFVRFILKAFSCVKKADWILVNSFYELESRVYDAMQMLGYPIYGIGPLMKMESESNSLGSECLDWLSQQKPASVIYVAFGSLAKLKTKDMESLALGLQASGLPFLWVIPLESISAMNNSGFASPNGFRDWIASLGLGFITSWAPQREVLGHSAVGAFVSHCGWNSVMESLCEAVPIVACPQGADQIGNARTIAEHLKVGVEIKREDDGSFTKESVQRAIKEIMKNEEARKRIAHLKQVIRDSTTWGSSYFNITKFIDYLFQLHCPCHS
ncbi:hypothetical protein KP509_15G076200 [Ceratopteris richardii]|uniref:UDP-glycosyltransferases domain-containing protein n=1 Tax=Ceratopteris richardii TaxID=49495 RepID=A0A8T2T764_CERRI|nr:hypothetical protein KP509_15G076200 [Ceratopteris richardii]